MNAPLRLGISACLLGEKVRYDGRHKEDPSLKETLGRYVEWVPVCPEVECGLPVPREPMRLVGDPRSPRLVTRKTGVDHTDRMRIWAKGKLRHLAGEGLCGFIFKSRSPSSGMSRVKIYSAAGKAPRLGAGLFAAAFMEAFPLLPVEDEKRFNDPMIRENFIERIFVVGRWNAFLAESDTLKGLIDFHSDHKLSIMAHSPSHLRRLGEIVAAGKGRSPRRLYEDYFSTLMEGLRLRATVKKNVHVLHRVMGGFQKALAGDEKKELAEVIEEYHRGVLPLVVPLTLLRHYLRKFGDPNLTRQNYLFSHPAERMLRNRC